MTRLENLEKSVSELSHDEFVAFTEWFERLQAERWDPEFSVDAINGRLDNLADAAILDFKTGRTKAL